jgi:hypothetical protein
MNYLTGLALNHDPPDLCFLSSYDYRREPPVLGKSYLLLSNAKGSVFKGIKHTGFSFFFFALSTVLKIQSA